MRRYAWHAARSNFGTLAGTATPNEPTVNYGMTHLARQLPVSLLRLLRLLPLKCICCYSQKSARSFRTSWKRPEKKSDKRFFSFFWQWGLLSSWWRGVTSMCDWYNSLTFGFEAVCSLGYHHQSFPEMEDSSPSMCDYLDWSTFALVMVINSAVDHFLRAIIGIRFALKSIFSVSIVLLPICSTMKDWPQSCSFRQKSPPSHFFEKATANSTHARERCSLTTASAKSPKYCPHLAESVRQLCSVSVSIHRTALGRGKLSLVKSRAAKHLSSPTI